MESVWPQKRQNIKAFDRYNTTVTKLIVKII